MTTYTNTSEGMNQESLPWEVRSICDLTPCRNLQHPHNLAIDPFGPNKSLCVLSNLHS